MEDFNKYQNYMLLDALTEKEEGFEHEAFITGIRALANLLENRLIEGGNKTKALSCLLECRNYIMRSIIED